VLAQTISKSGEIEVMCIINEDELTEEAMRRAVESHASVGNQDGKFYKGTLRSGQVLESESSIIILGDVNGNGRIEVADNSLMAAVGVGNSKTVLNEYAMLAADVNFNGRLDVADIAKNANKVVHWDTYKSQL
jgi:septum site-determining protein MinC